MNDLSMRKIADALGVSIATISRIETGGRRCTAEMATKIEDITRGIVHRALLRPDLWPTPIQGSHPPE
jgi:DNA-binding transcriptional regulator YdaS (Cro superfamily)